MSSKLKFSLKTTLDDIVGKGGWKKQERHTRLSYERKQLESRILNVIWEAGYRHKTLGEFKEYAERLCYGLGSFHNVGRKGIHYLNNELKRNGIEPIIPKLSKMDKDTRSRVQHWYNYGLYGKDYLTYNGLTRKDIYKKN